MKNEILMYINVYYKLEFKNQKVGYVAVQNLEKTELLTEEQLEALTEMVAKTYEDFYNLELESISMVSHDEYFEDKPKSEIHVQMDENSTVATQNDYDDNGNIINSKCLGVNICNEEE